MNYDEQFTDAELEKIVEEGLVYMCACPAQVAGSIRNLRALYRYQQQCLQNPCNDPEVHSAIAQSCVLAHTELQRCMARVLALEKWDRATLTMPANLRIKQAHSIANDLAEDGS